MILRKGAIAPAILLSLAVSCFGQENPTAQPASPGAANMAVDLPGIPLEEITGLLKQAVLKHLPASIAIEKQHNWGRQTRVLSVHGVQATHVMRNHGEWEKVKTVAPDLSQNLRMEVYSLSSPGENRIAFKIHLGMPAAVEVEKQTWQRGIRLVSTRSRARLQIMADLIVETKMSQVSEDSAAADHVASFQLNGARTRCECFVVQSIDGIGGEMAKTAGCLLEQAFKPWRWKIESDFQQKICDAVLTAGGDSEVRLGLTKLLWASTAARTLAIRSYSEAAAKQACFGPRVRSLPQSQEETASFLFELQIHGGHSSHASGDHSNHAEHHFDHVQHYELPAHSGHAEHSGTLTTHHEEPKKK